MLPTFRTPRLMLRPRGLADTEDCLALDREPEVTRFVSGPWDDPVAHRAFIESRTRGPYPSGFGYWTIRGDGDGSDFIGWVLLIPVDATGPEIEIGWRLRRHVWGQGLATEAARPVLDYAFSALGVAEVMAEIARDNTGSRRVAEKLGMQMQETAAGDDAPAVRYALRGARISQSVGISASAVMPAISHQPR